MVAEVSKPCATSCFALPAADMRCEGAGNIEPDTNEYAHHCASLMLFSDVASFLLDGAKLST